MRIMRFWSTWRLQGVAGISREWQRWPSNLKSTCNSLRRFVLVYMYYVATELVMDYSFAFSLFLKKIYAVVVRWHGILVKMFTVFCQYMVISIIVIVWQVCKLFRHIATNEQLVIAAEHNEFVLKNLGPLVSEHNF